MIKEISVQEAQEAVNNGYTFVDVREENEIAELAYDLPQVTVMPLSQLEDTYEQLPQDAPLLIACRSGGRSMRAAAFLLGHGYTQVANLTGGIIAWHAAGLPTVAAAKGGSCTPGGGCC